MLLHFKEFLVGKRIGSVADYALTLLIISETSSQYTCSWFSSNSFLGLEPHSSCHMVQGNIFIAYMYYSECRSGIVVVILLCLSSDSCQIDFILKYLRATFFYFFLPLGPAGYNPSDSTLNQRPVYHCYTPGMQRNQKSRISPTPLRRLVVMSSF